MAKQNNNTEGVVNPFKAGVTYDKFLAALPEGTNVTDYLSKEILVKADETAEERTNAFSWIENELKLHKYNVENKDALLAKSQAEHLELIKG